MEAAGAGIQGPLPWWAPAREWLVRRRPGASCGGARAGGWGAHGVGVGGEGLSRGWGGFLDFDPLSKHAEGLLKQIPGPGSGALTPQVPGGAWPVPVSQVPGNAAAAGVETTL